MEYDNRNSGALFKNDKQNDRQPDYRGSFTDANGNEFWVSSWIKVSGKTGEKFMSLSMTPKEAQAPVQKPVQQPVADMAFDDDVPF